MGNQSEPIVFELDSKGATWLLKLLFLNYRPVEKNWVNLRTAANIQKTVLEFDKIRMSEV